MCRLEANQISLLLGNQSLSGYRVTLTAAIMESLVGIVPDWTDRPEKMSREEAWIDIFIRFLGLLAMAKIVNEVYEDPPKALMAP